MHYGIRKYAYLNYSLLPEETIGPAPRDDIESLGYLLLILALGDLPWTYNVQYGTRKTRHNQVRIKKQRHSGANLVPDGLPFIGEMIDYARSLNFDQSPDYELLRSKIRETRARAGILASSAVEWHIPVKASSGLLISLFSLCNYF